jgi:hypothetical protein
MFKRIGALTVLAAVLFACGGSPTAPQTPGAGATENPGGVPTDTPAAGQTTPPNAGDIEAKVRALVPDGSTEIAKAQIGGLFQLTVTNPKSVAELEAFWDQKIPSLGITVGGKFTTSGVLQYALTNPDGGIVASPSSSGSGTDIVISLGLSS